MLRFDRAIHISSTTIEVSIPKAIVDRELARRRLTRHEFVEKCRGEWLILDWPEMELGFRIRGLEADEKKERNEEGKGEYSAGDGEEA